MIEVHEPQTNYYCPTCLERFENIDQHKIHYKSDFHRYNLKRKTVKLAPVTLQQFSTKIVETKNENTSELICNECNKKFNSVNTLNQHVVSKRHNPKLIKEVKIKQAKAPEIFIKNANKCLFCEKKSQSIEENELHMLNIHSFFIPQKQFCKNTTGLIEYLQEKIEVGHMCITCENKKAKDFQSYQALRKHMIDKGHTFMKTDEGFEQYQRYYDFSILFEQKLKQQSKVVPGIQFQKVKVFVNEADQDNDWEDVDDNQKQLEDDEQWQSQQESQQEQQIIEEKKKKKIKTYSIMKPTITAHDELLLPNGKILGHRKYRYLYKQTYRIPSWFINQQKMILGANSGNSNALIDRQKLFQLIKREKHMKQDIKREKKHYLSVGLTNNGLMHHFRIQNSM